MEPSQGEPRRPRSSAARDHRTCGANAGPPLLTAPAGWRQAGSRPSLFGAGEGRWPADAAPESAGQARAVQVATSARGRGPRGLPLLHGGAGQPLKPPRLRLVARPVWTQRAEQSGGGQVPCAYRRDPQRALWGGSAAGVSDRRLGLLDSVITESPSLVGQPNTPLPTPLTRHAKPKATSTQPPHRESRLMVFHGPTVAASD
jgi:hypothetical protein